MKGIRVTNKTRIFVACPASIATGGPELLHQLVCELRKLNIDAVMYYYTMKGSASPVHAAYVDYGNPYESEIIDKHDNVLIVPEVKTDLIMGMVNIQKVVWWLSVDNYYKSVSSSSIIINMAKIILYTFGIKKTPFRFKNNYGDPIHHFVQSSYAKNHILEHCINPSSIQYLSDYLNVHFIDSQKDRNEEKVNIVAYNPRKGITFTHKLIKFASDIKFVPVQNMTREEVFNLLSKAKVYIDFGNHPGKERIPREAAICGACVITNKQGSAMYNEDVPIPERFKFEGSEEDIPGVINLIKDCFENYEVLIMEFNEYRKLIEDEPEKFIEDLKKIFKKCNI